MWFKWLHIEKSAAPSERPALWWHQLESLPRKTMPFAHLFPQPPRSRRMAEGEAVRLVRDLVRVEIPERMEDIVKTYQSDRPTPEIEQIEAWQVESISRLDETECAAWGADGGQILEWFDHGELLAAWPTTTLADLEEAAAPRGIARVVAWLRGLIKPADEQLELASAEL